MWWDHFCDGGLAQEVLLSYNGRHLFNYGLLLHLMYKLRYQRLFRLFNLRLQFFLEGSWFGLYFFNYILFRFLGTKNGMNLFLFVVIILVHLFPNIIHVPHLFY